MDNIKICTECKRELPANTDYYFMKLGKLLNRCKECCGKQFTNKLTHVPRDGYMYCKKCDRELPHTFQYFPEDKSCKNGLRCVCRECNKYYGRFLNDNEFPHREWSNEDDLLLLNNYKNYTGEELKNKFFQSRTIRAIETRASDLGLQGKTTETLERSRKTQGKKVSEKLKGREITPEQRLAISIKNKEYYRTHESYWKGRKRSPEQCKQISERTKGKWLGDKNPRHINPLNGSKNGRWKGGILPIYTELRSETKDWKQISMKYCNYSCVITGGSFNNVHHTTPFRKIVDESFVITNIDIYDKVCDYSDNELFRLRKSVKDLHIYYGYGACISENVHKLFHDEYGYINFTPYDFLDFVYRIDCGDFDNWFKKNNLEININYDYIDYLESTLYEIGSA